MGGAAYTDQRKVTFRAREVRASGAAEKRRLVITGDNGVRKGLTKLLAASGTPP